MAQAEAQFKKFESMINSMTPVSNLVPNPGPGPVDGVAHGVTCTVAMQWDLQDRCQVRFMHLPWW